MRVLLAFLAALILLLAQPKAVGACEQGPTSWYNPTGWVGCLRTGEGIASRWPGPGTAVNDCVYPWDDCRPRTVTSLDTGRSIVVTPQMFCGCWVNGTGPNGETERLIDLDPSQVAALGLDWNRGLYRVRVSLEGASSAVLPNTAMRTP